MNAIIIVKFKLSDVCNPEDLEDTGMTFEEMVRYLISEEGIFSLVEDNGEVINIELIQ
jgi:hypothetical protein